MPGCMLRARAAHAGLEAVSEPCMSMVPQNKQQRRRVGYNTRRMPACAFWPASLSSSCMQAHCSLYPLPTLAHRPFSIMTSYVLVRMMLPCRSRQVKSPTNTRPSFTRICYQWRVGAVRNEAHPAKTQARQYAADGGGSGRPRDWASKASHASALIGTGCISPCTACAAALQPAPRAATAVVWEGPPARQLLPDPRSPCMRELYVHE